MGSWVRGSAGRFLPLLLVVFKIWMSPLSALTMFLKSSLFEPPSMGLSTGTLPTLLLELLVSDGRSTIDWGKDSSVGKLETLLLLEAADTRFGLWGKLETLRLLLFDPDTRLGLWGNADTGSTSAGSG